MLDVVRPQLVDGEVKKRDSAAKEKLDDARAKAKAGDSKAAIAEFREVVAQKCMLPNRAKDAAKEMAGSPRSPFGGTP